MASKNESRTMKIKLYRLIDPNPAAVRDDDGYMLEHERLQPYQTEEAGILAPTAARCHQRSTAPEDEYLYADGGCRGKGE